MYLTPMLSELRITPAGAGKTQLSRYLKYSREDHPRRCGENISTSKS